MQPARLADLMWTLWKLHPSDLQRKSERPCAQIANAWERVGVPIQVAAASFDLLNLQLQAFTHSAVAMPRFDTDQTPSSAANDEKWLECLSMDPRLGKWLC